MQPKERPGLQAWRRRNELRQGARAQPHRNRKRYRRKPKHTKRDQD